MHPWCVDQPISLGPRTERLGNVSWLEGGKDKGSMHVASHVIRCVPNLLVGSYGVQSDQCTRSPQQIPVELAELRA